MSTNPLINELSLKTFKTHKKEWILGAVISDDVWI